MAASPNKVNFVNQMLSSGTSTLGLLAGFSAAGAPQLFTIGSGFAVNGTTLSVPASAPFTGAQPPELLTAVTGSTTQFTTSKLPKFLLSVDLNGILLDPSQYTVAIGTTNATVTLTAAAVSTDQVHAGYLF